VAVLAMLVLAAGPKIHSLDDVVTTSRTGDGRYYVTCIDHSNDIVTKDDLLADNVCPHNPHTNIKRDFVILLDHSGSMDAARPATISALRSIVEEIQQNYTDYQISIAMNDAFLGSEKFERLYNLPLRKGVLWRGLTRESKGDLRDNESGQYLFNGADAGSDFAVEV
jgi:hypothetical protein